MGYADVPSRKNAHRRLFVQTWVHEVDILHTCAAWRPSLRGHLIATTKAPGALGAWRQRFLGEEPYEAKASRTVLY